MKDTSTIAIVNKLKTRLRRGDRREAARRTGFSPTYVALVLNENSKSFNMEVLTAISDIVNSREEKEKKAIAKIQKNLAK